MARAPQTTPLPSGRNFRCPDLSYTSQVAPVAPEPPLPTDLLSPDPLSQRPSPGSPGASGGLGGSTRDEDELDPELMALPPPPRAEQRRTLALLVIVAITASAMAYSLRGEAAYALAPGEEADVGDLYTADATKLADNGFVRAHGALGGALAVRFERPFEGDTYRVSPVMGRRDLWVEVRVPSGAEGARYVPPTAFSGRLVRWDSSGLRYRGLARAVESLTGEAIPSDARLLVDGESPGRARWALGLAVMFAGFAVWSLATMGRLLRRVD
jgi:hypothetical protein